MLSICLDRDIGDMNKTFTIESERTVNVRINGFTIV